MASYVEPPPVEEPAAQPVSAADMQELELLEELELLKEEPVMPNLF